MNLGETLVVSMVSTSESQDEDSLPANQQTVIRQVNAEEPDSAPSENTVTLFMVTPVAID